MLCAHFASGDSTRSFVIKQNFLRVYLYVYAVLELQTYS
jgi:hypothetical protein